MLSVICAFLAGLILGYGINTFLFFRPFFKAFSIPHASFSESPDNYGPPLKSVRRDILYYEPGGSSIWDDSLKKIPEGSGTIKGRIFADGRPAAGMEFSLIFSNGRRTEKTAVGNDGSYVIKVPKDNYYFNGILIYQYENIRNMVMINKVMKEMDLGVGFPQADNEKLNREFKTLAAKYGEAEAAKKIVEKMTVEVDKNQKCLLKVKDDPVIMPDFIYRSPIKIVSPQNAERPAAKSDISFIWEAYPGASTYAVTITNIEKKGTTTSYVPSISASGIRTNNISLIDLEKKAAEEYSGKEGCERNLPKDLCGVSIVAYDKEGKIISTSGESSTDLQLFKIK